MLDLFHKRLVKSGGHRALLIVVFNYSQVETMEGAADNSQQVIESLEAALKDIADVKEPLHSRLGPALAALFHSAHFAEIG